MRAIMFGEILGILGDEPWSPEKVNFLLCLLSCRRRCYSLLLLLPSCCCCA